LFDVVQWCSFLFILSEHETTVLKPMNIIEISPI
jgi:hypothetical protein